MSGSDSDCATGDTDCRSMSQSAGLSISCLRYETANWNESSRELLRRVESMCGRAEGRCL
ncbi:hypothetical protein J6590_072647 [Homalodisca vitripennis]|nr:hypothetical protein J6590_072647 [Homalodisca vitripennis]